MIYRQDWGQEFCRGDRELTNNYKVNFRTILKRGQE